MILSDFWKGESRSKYDQEGYDNTTNLDVHTEIGSARCQRALKSDGNVVTEPCLSVVDVEGNIYFFSTTSGKIWKRLQSTGLTSLLTTNGNGQHYGCAYFNGAIYCATATKLGKLSLNPDSLAKDFATLSADVSTAPDMAPMYVLNLKLWIGARSYIDSVDSSGTFTANALDLPANYLVSALTEDNSNLLIGTIIGGEVPHCRIFLWDTYSNSWTIEDDMPEIGVNCFLNVDNEIYAQCGIAGQLYQWTGAKMAKWKKIRGVVTSQWPQKGVVFKGKPYIAAENKIFSVHAEDYNMPRVIVHEFTAFDTITSITAQGNTIYVSHTSGIQTIDTENYATATLDTPEQLGNMQQVIVNYDLLPTGTSIGIAVQENSSGSYTAKTPIVDTIKRQVYFDGGLGDVNFMQAQITLTPSGDATPIIKSIEIK